MDALQEDRIQIRRAIVTNRRELMERIDALTVRVNELEKRLGWLEDAVNQMREEM